MKFLKISSFPLLFTISCFLHLQAQDISGCWAGKIYTDTSSYEFKLYLNQDRNELSPTLAPTSKYNPQYSAYKKGKKFTGTAYIIDKNKNYEEILIKGEETRKGIFYQETKLMYSNMDTTSRKLKKVRLVYDVVDNEAEVLDGKWGIDSMNVNTFEKTIHLTRTDCSVSSNRKSDNISDPVTKKIKNYKTNITLQTDSSGQVLKALNRKVKTGTTIHTKNKSFEIEIYDNRREDGDSVTIIFNDKIIMNHYSITNKPLRISLELDDTKKRNTLIFHADNLGQVPPNTATISLIENNRQVKEYALKSDLENSDILYLVP